MGKIDFVKQTNPWGSTGADKPDAPDPTPDPNVGPRLAAALRRRQRQRRRQK